jgi:diacylglycerol kinase (ATP)
MRGEHTQSEKVIYFQTNQISIKSPEHIDLNLDGEYGGPLPGDFRCLKHHLNVLVNN